MPNIAPPCSTCQHPRGVHNTPDGPETFCRVTRCACMAYLPPEDEPAEPEDDARRLVIEIPEGFIVNVQLVPIDREDSPQLP